jgi:hypothetical protein
VRQVVVVLVYLPVKPYVELCLGHSECAGAYVARFVVGSFVVAASRFFTM